MSVFAAIVHWLRRLAASAPSVWDYDPVFRWVVIAASTALIALILRAMPRDPEPVSSAPSVSAGATLGSAAIATPPALPKIQPGQSLDAVTIKPGRADRFGMVPTTSRK
jgi:hypothetical protein